MQRIIHLQDIANRFLDAFNDAVKVMKSHILVMNASTRIVVLEEHTENDQNVSRLKRGRSI